MVNCNPETVSTDYDTSDRLYFEPLTLEDVLNVVEKERPLGVIVQFGGQTPLKLAVPLQAAGVPILGTSPDAIDCAEDRQRFSALLTELGLNQAAGATARSLEEARAIAAAIGYPVLVRPSYVLGGRAMRLVHDDQDLDAYMREAVTVSPEHPVLIDKFLEDSLEIDVDAVADGERVVVGGVMEHVEKAGIHSGDAACALPPYSLGDDQIHALRAQTKAMARALNVVGLINVQFAIRNDTIYVLEVNPRASRTVPFVSKVIGVPLAKIATRAMLGHGIADVADLEERALPHIAVKEAVFPFIKFPGVDMILGPEMKSTGEVMGIDVDFRQAYLKAQLAADSRHSRLGQGLHLRQEPRQAPPGAPGQAPGGHGLLAGGHRGHRAGPRAARHGRGDRPQGRGRAPPQRPRLHEAGGDRPRLQHARGRPGPRGLLHDPPHRGHPAHPVLPHPGRGAGRGGGHRGAAQGRAAGAEPAGVPPWGVTGRPPTGLLVALDLAIARPGARVLDRLQGV